MKQKRDKSDNTFYLIAFAIEHNEENKSSATPSVLRKPGAGNAGAIDPVILRDSRNIIERQVDHNFAG